MGLRALIAKLTLDTTAYEAGLDRAGGLTDKWASKQEKLISKKFFKAFGFGAVISELHSAMEKASKITDEAAKHGISTDTFQELEYASKRTGYTIEEMVKMAGKLPPEVRDAAEEFRRLDIAIPVSKLQSISSAKQDLETMKDAADNVAASFVGMFASLGRTAGYAMTALEGYLHLAAGILKINKNGRNLAEEMFAQIISETDYDALGDESMIQAKSKTLAEKIRKRPKLKDAKQSFIEEVLTDHKDVLRTHTNAMQAVGAYGGGQTFIDVRTTMKLVEKIERNTRPGEDKESSALKS